MTLPTDAAYLAQALPHLHATRVKGTPRPWRQNELTPERQAELDHRARQERTTTRDPLPPRWWARHGATPTIASRDPLAEQPAPLHLDITDLIRDITHAAQAAATDQALTDGNLVIAVWASTTNDTHQLLTYLATTAPPTSHNPELHHLRTRTARIFQDVVDGQRLKTPCPWCGHERLYFRSIGPDHAREIVVRCDSDACQPPDADCGTWHRGRPCWPLHEWDWLAHRIDHANAKRATTSATRHAQPAQV